MFYKQQATLLQVPRFHCRNPRCAAKLKSPALTRAAFCCRGCEEQYYSRRCRVCETLFTRKTSRRQVCSRPKCRYQWKCHPEQYSGLRYPQAEVAHNGAKKGVRYPSSPMAHNALANPIKIGVQSGDKSGRGWRIVAGPEPPGINLRVPPDPPTSKANAAFAEYWRKTKRRAARKAIIKRTTPPVNAIGGYKFPKAPTIDLKPISESSKIATSKPSQPFIGDGLEIPDFLRRQDSIMTARGPGVPTADLYPRRRGFVGIEEGDQGNGQQEV
jgi:hypothetical protein